MNRLGAFLGGGTLLAVATAAAVAAAPAISWTLFPGAASQSAGEEQGKIYFQNACAVCHAAEPDRPGTMSLQFKYAGHLPAALEQRTDLTPDFVKFYIRHGIAMMPSFRKTELDDAQVAAIAAYLTRKRE